jgi:MFS transporter, PAT family, beta-lactamase induction signal transducer AmpG
MNKMLRSVFSRRMMAVLLLGFSSGLPLLLIGSTLKAWMKESNIDLTVIGVFALVGMPYTLKFLWAPIMDRFTPPFLDRRRGWILICQLLLIIAFVALALSHPADGAIQIAVVALIIAFFSASQDIAIDAYRREILQEVELGFGSSVAVNGYRMGLLFAGAGALAVADKYSWKVAYLSMAAAMVVSVSFTFLAPPVKAIASAPKTLADAVVKPFVEYFQRKGAFEILAFILLFKIGDQMASDMFTPFYLDIGFTKTEISLVSKVFGFWAVIGGGILGGLIILKIGIHRSLWVFGILQAVSTALFGMLAHFGHSLPALAWVVGFENLSSGMGTAAYVGYMASICDVRFTATQYALLSSIIGIPRVLLGSTSGFLAKHMGWESYFIFCGLIAIPGLLLLLRIKQWSAVSADEPPRLMPSR